MCGGAGSRLDVATEKPLHEIAGVSLVDRVIQAVVESRVEDMYAVTSPLAPDTARHVAEQWAVERIEAPGDGYVPDLQYALDEREPGAGPDEPVVTIAADLPLLAGDAIDQVLDVYDAGSLTVCSPATLPAALGIGTDAAFEVEEQLLVPAGVNVVGGDPEEPWVTWDARFAVNVNYLEDAAVAERLLSTQPD